MEAGNGAMDVAMFVWAQSERMRVRGEEGARKSVEAHGIRHTRIDRVHA